MGLLKVFFAGVLAAHATHAAHPTHSTHSSHTRHAAHTAHTSHTRHTTGARGHRRRRRGLARDLGDRRLSSDHHYGGTDRVDERQPHDLGRIDHARFNEVFVLLGGRIETEVALSLN